MRHTNIAIEEKTLYTAIQYETHRMMMHSTQNKFGETSLRICIACG